ncbi:hypothetical protein GE107_10195 [Cohnella sp. CFH 77786]|uniref:hypothetical protein n=1 Tax=Cohnella sp. CFH 77786 TaxID=2662265 RepID=UPI001C60A71C|nr:hypothetical protein [Cohnella sp. CFH 77786]MBW5446430.1 hypothetical protein [Cohnella sp. CFH 77786]
MNLSNCRGCGKLQLRNAEALCPDCFQQHLADSRRVKAFLVNNPGASLIDLVRHTGISLKKAKEHVQS